MNLKPWASESRPSTGKTFKQRAKSLGNLGIKSRHGPAPVNPEDLFIEKLKRLQSIIAADETTKNEAQRIVLGSKKLNKMLKERIMKQIDEKSHCISSLSQFKKALRLLGLLPIYTSEFKAAKAYNLRNSPTLNMHGFLETVYMLISASVPLAKLNQHGYIENQEQLEKFVALD